MGNNSGSSFASFLGLNNPQVTVEQEKINDLLSGEGRPTNMPSGDELLVQSNQWNQSIEFSMNQIEYAALLGKEQAPSVTSGYELTCSDNLNQELLKTQCLEYKSILELENEGLTSLDTVFANVESNVNMQGATFDVIQQVWSDYRSVISCLKLAKLFDINDNELLYNRLGSEKLNGSVILHGIDYSKSEYEYECMACDNCNRLADSTDDFILSAQYRQEANIHQCLANNFFAEWQRYLALKQEFEEIKLYTANFFTTGVEYRNRAAEGMELLAGSFIDDSYTVVPGMSEWRAGVAQLNEDKLLAYAEKWKNDEKYDLDAISEVLSRDAEDVTELEYLSLCYVVNKLEYEDLTTVLMNSYTCEKVYTTRYTTGGGKGYYQYTRSTALEHFKDVYASNLVFSKSEFDPQREGESYSDYSSRVTDADEKINKYNILYVFTEAINDPIIVGDFDTDASNYHDDKGTLSATCSDIVKGKKFVITIEGTKDVEFTPSIEHPASVYNQEYTVYRWAPDLGESFKDCTETKTRDYFYIDIDLMVKNEVVNFAAKEGISLGLGDLTGDMTTAQGAVVTTTVDVMLEAAEIEEKIRQAEINNQRVDNVIKYSEAQSITQKFNCSGTMIVSSDDRVYVTLYSYDRDAVTEQVNAYNEAYPNNSIYYNEDTFLSDALTDSDYREQLDSKDGFFDFWSQNRNTDTDEVNPNSNIQF